MKNYLKHLTTIGALIAGLASSPAFAATMQCPTAGLSYVAQGGDAFTANSTGLVTAVNGGHNIASLLAQGCTTVGLPAQTIGASGTAGTLTIYPATAAYGTLAITDTGNVGAYNTIINNAAVLQADTLTIPDPGNATASFVLTKGTQTISGALTLSAASTALSVTNNAAVGTLNGNTITTGTGVLTLAAAKTLTVSNTLTLAGTDSTTMTFPGSSDTVLGAAAANAITGVNTFGAGSSIVSKTSTSATDINPPFDNRLLGNPVVKVAYGTCSIASINAKTCVILTGVSSRTINVEYFDVVSAGTPATCTGVLLEDNNGTPVVVATMNVAQLGSGVHDIPLTAALGVGFGAGTGLTSGKGLQLDVNGSSCITSTAMTYAITYTVQ